MPQHTAGERESRLPWQPSHRLISKERGLSFAVITDVFRTHTYWSVSYKWVVYFHTGCFSIGLFRFSKERPDSKPLCFPLGFGISSCRESDKTVVYKDTHTLNMPIFTYALTHTRAVSPASKARCPAAYFIIKFQHLILCSSGSSSLTSFQ